MDDNRDTIKIFNITDDSVVLPSGDTINNEYLISDGLDQAISGDTVKSIMIPEEINILLPNYVIDFSNIKEIYEFQALALDSFIREEGDATIYINTKTGITKLGHSDLDTLDKVLVTALSVLFNGECMVYRNYIPNKELQPVYKTDNNNIRLGL